MIIFGLFGNIIVLYASIKYDAIQIDNISLMLLQNVAFSDIFIIILDSIPMFVSLCYGGWGLGETTCFIVGALQTIPIYNEIMITLSISGFRLWMIQKPPAVRQLIHPTHVRIVMAIIIVVSAVPAIGLILANSDADYEAEHMNCELALFEEVIPSVTIWSIYIALPIIILISTNISILFIVVKSSRRMEGSAVPNKTVNTILWICCTFILSYVPFVIIFLLDNSGQFHIKDHFKVLATYSLTINTVANPLIYVVTNGKFRSFLTTHILFFGPCHRTSTNTEVIETPNTDKCLSSASTQL